MAIGGPQNGGDEFEGGEGGGIFADINITPLTDIFLVLLIIFMVTTTAIAEAGQDRGAFKVNLPKGSKGDAGEVPRDLVVAILADGRAVVGGKVQDDAELAKSFEASAKLNPDTVLVVQADEGVRAREGRRGDGERPPGRPLAARHRHPGRAGRAIALSDRLATARGDRHGARQHGSLPARLGARRFHR